MICLTSWLMVSKLFLCSARFANSKPLDDVYESSFLLRMRHIRSPSSFIAGNYNPSYLYSLHRLYVYDWIGFFAWSNYYLLVPAPPVVVGIWMDYLFFMLIFVSFIWLETYDWLKLLTLWEEKIPELNPFSLRISVPLWTYCFSSLFSVRFLSVLHSLNVDNWTCFLKGDVRFDRTPDGYIILRYYLCFSRSWQLFIWSGWVFLSNFNEHRLLSDAFLLIS